SIYLRSDFKDLSLPLTACRNPRAHIESINSFLEYEINGSTAIDFITRERDIEFEEFHTVITDCTISDSGKPYRTPPRVRDIPYVRSQIGGPRQNTTRQNIFTFENRNFNVQSVRASYSPIDFPKRVAKTFAKVYLDPRKLNEVRNDITGISLKDLGDWLDTRDPSALKLLSNDVVGTPNLLDDLISFKSMVKSDVKPKLDDSVLTKLVAGQNIMYHRKYINALFSPFFNQIFSKIIYCLLPKFIIYNKMSLEEFAEQISLRLVRDIDDQICTEIDFSKFDKSQDSLIKNIEKEIYTLMGVSDELLALWEVGEHTSRFRTSDKSFSGTIGAQRRSGASNTFLGNTITTMAILSMYYTYEDCELCMFAGDDSLILGSKSLDDCCELINKDFNMESKFIHNSTPYFCSKYILSFNGKALVVPDPYKMLVKLGKSYFDSKSNVDERFQSFKDLTSSYDNDLVVSKLVFYHSLRYKPNPFCTEAVSVIHCLSSNLAQFKRLYFFDNGVTLTASLAEADSSGDNFG
ncbi:polymerase, partial [Mint vein banding-associated virus]